MVCEIIPQKLGRILPPIYPEQPVLRIRKIPPTAPVLRIGMYCIFNDCLIGILVMVCEIIHPQLGRISSPINPKQPQNLPIFLPPKPPGSSKFFFQTFEAFVSWSVPDTVVGEHRFNPAWGGGNTKLLECFSLNTCSFEGREVFFKKKIWKNRKSYIHNYISRAMTSAKK